MAGVPVEEWRGVDEGWGWRAAEFAALAEPGNCREYVAMHQHLGVGPGVRLLDVACGSGLAIELALARGAGCAGIDASHRLVAIAQDRAPAAEPSPAVEEFYAEDLEELGYVMNGSRLWGRHPESGSRSSRSSALRRRSAA